MPPRHDDSWTIGGLTKLAAGIGAVALLISNLSTRAALIPYQPPPNSNAACRAYHPELLDSCEDLRLFPYRGSEYVITSCDIHRRKRPPIGHFVVHGPGARLFLWDVHNPTSEPEDISDRFPESFHSLGLSVRKLSDDRVRLYTANRKYPNSSMDVWDLDLSTSEKATEVASVRHELVYNPNSVTSVDENTFIFTNEHKYTSEMFPETALGLPLADVVLVTISDGKEPVLRSLKKMATPNGVDINREKKKLYIASMSYGLYEFDYSGSGQDFTLGSHKVYQSPFIPDNVQVSPNGDVCVAGHPHSLLITSAMTNTKAPPAPSWATRLLRVGENATIIKDYSQRRLWNKKDHVWKTLFMDNGTLSGASTTAVTFDNGKKAAITGLFSKGIVVCDEY